MTSKYRFYLAIGGLLLLAALLLVNTNDAVATHAVLPRESYSSLVTSGNGITITTSGSGIIVSSPAGINCGTTCSASFPVGIVVALRAINSPMCTHFYQWSGDILSSNNPVYVTVPANLNIKANFVWLCTPKYKYFPIILH